MHVSNQAKFDTTLIRVRIARRYDLAQQVKLIEAEMKAISDDILTTLKEQNLDAFETEDLVASIITQSRASLSERKLLERGVPMSVIEDSKIKSTSSFVRVSKRDEKDAA